PRFLQAPGVQTCALPIAAMDHSAHAGHGTQPMAGMDHGPGGMQQHPASEDGNPLIDMQAMSLAPKLDDPGVGLRGNGRDVLTYADRKRVVEGPRGAVHGG